MKFIVLSVANKAPEWIDAGFNEYARRLPAASRIEFRQIKPATRSGGGQKSVQQWVELEAERIRSALPPRAHLVVLDERGKHCTTAQLARHIEQWRNDGGDVAFVIGGADGTAPELRGQAELMLALSALTLPHGLCRVVLAEQLYRAVSLLAGHPYHRAGTAPAGGA